MVSINRHESPSTNALVIVPSSSSSMRSVNMNSTTLPPAITSNGGILSSDGTNTHSQVNPHVRNSSVSSSSFNSSSSNIISDSTNTTSQFHSTVNGTSSSSSITNITRISEILRRLELNQTQPEAMKTCFSILSLLTRDENDKLYIIKDGIEIILSIMLQHIDRIEVIEAGCDLLWSLAFNCHPIKEAIAKYDGTAILVRSLKRHSRIPSFMKSVCGALSNICQYQLNQELVTQHGGLQPLIGSLHLHQNNLKLLPFIFDAIASIIVNNSENARIVSGLGLIPVVISTLNKHRDIREIVKSGCHTLAIMSDVKGQASKVAFGGGVNIILNLLEFHPLYVELHRVAAVVILRMLQESNQIGKDVCMNEGIRILLLSLERGGAQQDAVAAITHILYTVAATALHHNINIEGQLWTSQSPTLLPPQGLEHFSIPFGSTAMVTMPVTSSTNHNSSQPISPSNSNQQKTLPTTSVSVPGEVALASNRHGIQYSTLVGILDVLEKFSSRRDVVRATSRLLMNFLPQNHVCNALDHYGVVGKLLICVHLHRDAKDVMESLSQCIKKITLQGKSPNIGTWTIEKISGLCLALRMRAYDESVVAGLSELLRQLCDELPRLPETLRHSILNTDVKLPESNLVGANIGADCSSPSVVWTKTILPSFEAILHGFVSSGTANNGKSGTLHNAGRVLESISGCLVTCFALRWFNGEDPQFISLHQSMRTLSSRYHFTGFSTLLSIEICDEKTMTGDAIDKNAALQKRLSEAFHLQGIVDGCVKTSRNEQETIHLNSTETDDVGKQPTVDSATTVTSSPSLGGSSAERLRKSRFKASNASSKGGSGVGTSAIQSSTSLDLLGHSPQKNSTGTNIGGSLSAGAYHVLEDTHEYATRRPDGKLYAKHPLKDRYFLQGTQPVSLLPSKTPLRLLDNWPSYLERLTHFLPPPETKVFKSSTTALLLASAALQPNGVSGDILSSQNPILSSLLSSPTVPQRMHIVYESTRPGGRSIVPKLPTPALYLVPPGGVGSAFAHSCTFDSEFESGNLHRAIQTDDNSYDLVLRADVHTQGHTQWFYFAISNTHTPEQIAAADRGERVSPVLINFSILNFTKPDSLFNSGMQPVVYSTYEAQSLGRGWHRAGESIRYANNAFPRQNPSAGEGNSSYYTLSFSLQCHHPRDTLLIAYCYPYTMTDLTLDLKDLLARPGAAQWVRKQKLCTTLGGTDCDLLIFTDFTNEKDKIGPMNLSEFGDTEDEVNGASVVPPHLPSIPTATGSKKKKSSNSAAGSNSVLNAGNGSSSMLKPALFFSGRVHPGETPASWMMKGLLDFLSSPHPVAVSLRRIFVIYVVPILNPDGVILGNNRCSLAGVDLNRQWKSPSKISHPTIAAFKSLMAAHRRIRDVPLYIDLHGHSRKYGVFMFGCDDRKKSSTRSGGSGNSVRAFPRMLAAHAIGAKYVSFQDCSFTVRKGREATARVVAARELNIPLAFTLEATFCGPGDGPLMGCHMNTGHMQEVGVALIDATFQWAVSEGYHREYPPTVINPQWSVTLPALCGGMSYRVRSAAAGYAHALSLASVNNGTNVVSAEVLTSARSELEAQQTSRSAVDRESLEIVAGEDPGDPSGVGSPLVGHTLRVVEDVDNDNDEATEECTAIESDSDDSADEVAATMGTDAVALALSNSTSRGIASGGGLSAALLMRGQSGTTENTRALPLSARKGSNSSRPLAEIAILSGKAASFHGLKSSAPVEPNKKRGKSSRSGVTRAK